MRRTKAFKGKKNEGLEIKLEELPPNVRKIIEGIAERKKAEEEDDDDDAHMMPMPFFAQEERALESRGVLIIDKEISKQSLARVSTKLIALHFDEKFDDTVQIILNSPGGYLDAAWAFIDVMDSVRMPIRTVAMGVIASAATMIFCAGDERVMAPNSEAMIHHFSSMNWGSYPQLIAARKAEDLQYKRIAEHLLRFSKYKKLSDIDAKVLLPHDHWMSPQEMKKHGLCDEVLGHRKRSKK